MKIRHNEKTNPVLNWFVTESISVLGDNFDWRDVKNGDVDLTMTIQGREFDFTSIFEKMKSDNHRLYKDGVRRGRNDVKSEISDIVTDFLDNLNTDDK